MNLLVISQVYSPDTVAVAQILGDFCEDYVKNNYGKITVYTSRYNYENKSVNYDSRESKGHLTIFRLNHTSFGKKTILGRVLDFLSFNIVIFFRLLFINKKKYDAILGLTTPPLLPFICVLISKIKRIPFYYWAMDLQPELSINSKLINKGSLNAKFLSYIGKFSFKNASKIIALDKLMKQHIYNNSKNTNIEVIPVWPVLTKLYEGKRADNQFRCDNNFKDKIVIMYSGNHSFVHPLNTILDVAYQLKDNSKFLFVFIGEGTQKPKVKEYINKGCTNILILPYQPKDYIHISLSSADFQVVVMGEQNNGITHPNKIYGSMLAGCEVIYIGPQNSFISSILNDCKGNISVNHNDVELLTNILLKKAEDINLIIKQGAKNRAYALINFDAQLLKHKMCKYLTS